MKLILGDCLTELKNIEDNSIDCVITSPPYWALRDYGVDGQLGLEPTFEEYITKLCDIFDEVKRVLKKEGTCWVNLGDTYYGSGKGAGGDGSQKESWTRTEKEERICNHCGKKFIGRKFQNFCGSTCNGVDNTKRIIKGKLPDKTLCCIPDRFKIEMINRGWICRNEIIWHKPNCIPSSAKDRFTVDYEKVFFFVKSKKYFFKTQYEKAIRDWANTGGSILNDTGWHKGAHGNDRKRYKPASDTTQRNKRCVWQVSTKPNKEAHFATYPEALIEPMIDAGCPDGGVVLDPFFGAGTTGVVAKKQKKDCVGIELNPEYMKIAEARINAVQEDDPKLF